jgi:hypothetical protein
MKTAALFFVPFLMLAGCVTRPLQLPDNEALIAPKTVMVVAPPRGHDGSSSVAQSIVAHYRDQTFAFDAQIQMAPQTFDLVALDAMGRRALTVHWNGDKMNSEAAPWLPPLMRPADILADIAIVYGPGDEIAQSVANAGATLSETGTTRTIAKGNHDLIVVEYGEGSGWSRAAKLRNLAFGYEIDIRSVALSP